MEILRILQWRGFVGFCKIGLSDGSPSVGSRAKALVWVFQRQSPGRGFWGEVPQKLKQNVKLSN